MKIEADRLILSTGKVLNVNNGIIGLSTEKDAIYGGYDDCYNRIDWDGEVNLTDDEWNEICQYMSEAWRMAMK